MSDKQIGEYPLNIKIVSGSYEIANIDITVPIHVDPNERVEYQYNGGVSVHAKVPDEFKDKMRKALVDDRIVDTVTNSSSTCQRTRSKPYVTILIRNWNGIRRRDVGRKSRNPSRTASTSHRTES